jgi:hypothetical protein
MPFIVGRQNTRNMRKTPSQAQAASRGACRTLSGPSRAWGQATALSGEREAASDRGRPPAARGAGSELQGQPARSIPHRGRHTGAQPEPDAAQRLQNRAAWGAAQPLQDSGGSRGHTWGACTWRGDGLAAPFLSERFIAGSSALKLAYWPCIGAGTGRAAAACQVRGVLAPHQASVLLQSALFKGQLEGC